MPKCDLPIDVYIYCTKDNKTKLSSNSLQYYVIDNKNYKDYLGNWNGKVVAKFTLNKVEEIYPLPHKPTFFVPVDCLYHLDMGSAEQLKNKTCVSYFELNDYLKRKKGYAWHISNLEIFDKPKELNEFKTRHYPQFAGMVKNKTHYELRQLTKAPQSYMFVDID